MLIPEILLETLHFLDRDSLDAVQLATKGLRSTVDRSAPLLALREVFEVFVVSVHSVRLSASVRRGEAAALKFMKTQEAVKYYCPHQGCP